MLQKHGTEGKANRMSDLISREEALERLQILKKFNTAEIIQDVMIDAGWYVRGIWRTGFSAADIVKNIVSWQPLPKPYRPKRSEGE